MPEQVHAPKHHEKAEPTAELHPAERDAETQRKLDESEAMLDEIDRVLAEDGLDTEQAAYDQVSQFIQKGGE